MLRVFQMLTRTISEFLEKHFKTSNTALLIEGASNLKHNSCNSFNILIPYYQLSKIQQFHNSYLLLLPFLIKM